MKTVKKALHLRTKLIFGIVFLLFGYFGVLGYHAVGLFGGLKAIRAAAGQGDSSDLPDLTSQAARHMRALRWGIGPLFPIFDLIQWIPGIGRIAGQVEPLVMYGFYLSSAGDEAMQGLAPLLDGLDPSAGGPVSRQVVAVLAGSQAQFAAAQRDVTYAAHAREELDLAWIPGDVGDQLREFDKRFPLLQGGVGLLANMPQLAGVEAARTYLLVVENNDELRASGGFISAFGLLQVQQGDITRFEFQDSYAIDNFQAGYPPPPDPIATYMLAGYWVPRDANWSPDFPVAARQIRALYTASTGTPVDGVIAVDQEALVWMLGALGPVQVGALNEPVSAQNVISWMRRAWAPEPDAGLSSEWWAQRKDFIGQLGTAMKDRLLGLDDPAALAEVGMAALQAVQAGHILLFFNQPGAQSALVQAELDGAVRPDGVDFLMLVDSNLGFNKADALVERSLDYQVNLRDPQNPQAVLRVSYRSGAQPGAVCKHEAVYNLTYEGLQQRCYWDYWRVLAAGDSQVLSSQVAAIPAEQLLTGQVYDGQVSQSTAEGGTSEFAGMMVLASGETRELGLQWRLPARVIQNDSARLVYALRVQKQPGLLDLPMKVTVSAPEGMSLQPQPGWQAGPQPGSWTWSGTVVETIQFRLLFSRP